MVVLIVLRQTLEVRKAHLYKACSLNLFFTSSLLLQFNIKLIIAPLFTQFHTLLLYPPDILFSLLHQDGGP